MQRDTWQRIPERIGPTKDEIKKTIEIGNQMNNSCVTTIGKAPNAAQHPVESDLDEAKSRARKSPQSRTIKRKAVRLKKASQKKGANAGKRS